MKVIAGVVSFPLLPLFVMSLLAGVASTAVAQELLYVKEPTMGVNVIPAERNRWTAKWIRPASDVKAAVEYPDVEFFRREYGKSCAPFTLDVTPKGASRLWGETYDAHSGQAVRFGRGWVDYPYARVEVRADIVQTGAGETAWTLFLHGRKGKKELTTFKTAAGTNAVARTVRMIRPRHVYADGGLELVAKGGEGIRAEVRNLRVVPVRIPVTYRRAFTLRERPWRAGLSLPGRYWCPVRVNGVDVQHVTFDYGTCTMDIAPLLAAGTNVVEVTVDANSGWERTPRTAVEVFAVYADGTRDLVASDGSWQACGADGVWGGVRTEGTCGIDRMPNGHPYSTGTLPLHAGALAPKPHGTEWPVFDEGQAIRWDVALPPGLKEGKVDVEVVNAFTGEPEQRRTGETPVPPVGGAVVTIFV